MYSVYPHVAPTAQFIFWHNYFQLTILRIYTIYTLFTADYVSVMESLFFNGSATFDRQCVNITILDDDVRELSAIGPQPEQFRVLLRMSEPNDEVQLSIQTAIVSIQDDDCKYAVRLQFTDNYSCIVWRIFSSNTTRCTALYEQSAKHYFDKTITSIVLYRQNTSFSFILQFPQDVLKLVSAVAALAFAYSLRQTVGVMRTVIWGEIVVMIYNRHVHEVKTLH